MMRGRQLLSIALLAGVATLASAGQARAVLQLTLFVNGTFVGTYVDNVGGQDLNPAVGQLNVPTSGLTGVNTLQGAFLFTNLGAQSSNDETPTDAQLSQNGDVQSAIGGGGTIEVLANDTDYFLPPVPQQMTSTASVSFTNATGETRTFDSWFNPSNSGPVETTPGDPTTIVYPMEVPAPTIVQIMSGTDSDSDTTSTGVPSVIPFSLTNRTFFSLAASTALTERTVGFSGKTIISAIPEPGTMALVLGGLPILAVGAWRRRRAAQA